MAEERQHPDDEAGACQPRGMTDGQPQHPPGQEDRKRKAVPVCGGINELHHAKGIDRHAGEGREHDIAALQQRVGEAAEQQRRQHQGISQAQYVQPEEPERDRVEKVDVPGMDILNVAIQHLTVEQPLGDVGVKAVVRGVPVAIVKVPQEHRVDEERRKKKDRRARGNALAHTTSGCGFSGEAVFFARGRSAVPQATNGYSSCPSVPFPISSVTPSGTVHRPGT